MNITPNYGTSAPKINTTTSTPMATEYFKKPGFFNTLKQTLGIAAPNTSSQSGGRRRRRRGSNKKRRSAHKKRTNRNKRRTNRK
jgi:hypothetical protein